MGSGKSSTCLSWPLKEYLTQNKKVTRTGDDARPPHFVMG
jgi:hypothetical protein